MPKIRTHSGAKARVKLSSKGKLLRRKAFSNHFLGYKSSSRKREYGKEHSLSSGNKRNVKRMLGK